MPVIYLLLAAVITGYAFTHASKTGYEIVNLGSGEKSRLPVDDSVVLDFSFYTQEDDAWGITLNEYYDNNSKLEDAWADVKVYRDDNPRPDQTLQLKLADEYSEDIYNGCLSCRHQTAAQRTDAWYR